jgi:hypothetical protein
VCVTRSGLNALNPTIILFNKEKLERHERKQVSIGNRIISKIMIDKTDINKSEICEIEKLNRRQQEG